MGVGFGRFTDLDKTGGPSSYYQDELVDSGGTTEFQPAFTVLFGRNRAKMKLEVSRALTGNNLYKSYLNDSVVSLGILVLFNAAGRNEI